MTNPDIKNQKQALRIEIKKQLDALTPAQRQTASTELCQKITQHLTENPHIKTITSFAHLPFEPDLSSLHKLNPHITIAYPHALKNTDLTFHAVQDPAEMPTGYFNLRQPIPTPETLIPPQDLHLILTPAFAFTPDGDRLGKGGGYYDKFLTKLPPNTQIIGIAFKSQIIPKIPTEPHDLPVQKLITA